jgi:hypothetical protein
MHRTEGKTMAIQKALETLCYVNSCGSVAIQSARIHVETGGAVARQLLDPPSLYERDDIFQSYPNPGFRSVKAKPDIKNKPTLAALVKQVTKYLASAGISASAVGDGHSIKGIKWNETDLGILPAELWPQDFLDTTPDLLRVAGLSETAARLNLHYVPFAPDEARIVHARGHVRRLNERVAQQALARARDHERGVHGPPVVHFAAGFPRRLVLDWSEAELISRGP